jgi:plastocyanin
MAHLKRARCASLASAAALTLVATVPSAFACPLPTGQVSGILASSGCLGGCGPTDCSTTESTHTSAGAGGAGQSTTFGAGGRGGTPFEISMVDFSFLPNTPIIKPNTVVRWNNTSMFFQHTTTRTPTWDSGLVSPGNFFDHNFTASNAGFAYDYVCTLHFGMEGTLSVTNFGDANLDGIVNLSDFNALAANFGQSNRTWEQGDFNEDGSVNLTDFNLLAANFGKEIEPAPPGSTISFGFGGNALVPEPTMIAMVLLTPALLTRRRKH